MRGVAVLAAALAVWIAMGGALPSVRPPRLLLPARSEWLRALSLAVATGLIVVTFTGVGAVALAGASLVFGGALVISQAQAARSRQKGSDKWPDLLVIVRARLAGGAPLSDAVVVAGAECGGVLGAMSARLDEALRGGTPFGEALERERQQLADPIADRILTSLSFASQVGGSRVAEVLGALGRSVSDDMRVRLAHDAALTQQRLTAGVALVAPWALLMLTISTNPQAAEVYSTSGGQRVVAVGLVSTVIGFALARRSGRLSRASRVFR